MLTMRETIYKPLETLSEGTVINDPTSIDWKTFKWNNGYFEHIVTKHETEQFFKISGAYYGTYIYTDLIKLLNNIIDPFEMIPGSKIKLPKLEDIKQFIFENRK